MLLGLLLLYPDNTLFFNLCCFSAPLQFFSYLVPITLKALYPHYFPAGHFHLGRWSRLNSVVAILFLLFAIVQSCFPYLLPVTPLWQTLNWAGPSSCIVLLLLVVAWFLTLLM